MCLLFHDWKHVKNWKRVILSNDPEFHHTEVCVTGFECRKCGRRKIKKGWFLDDTASDACEKAKEWCDNMSL